MQLNSVKHCQIQNPPKCQKPMELCFCIYTCLAFAHCIYKFIYMDVLLPHGKVWEKKKGFSHGQFCQLSYFYFFFHSSCLGVAA